MNKPLLLTLALVLLAGSVGFVGGVARDAEQQAPNYLIQAEFTLGENQSYAEALETMNRWGQAGQSLGLNIRTFMHEWGPGNSFYLIIETSDWEEVGTLFERMVEQMPELMNEPFGWGGHSDIIMRELPIQ
ncbi:MAG: hypothetical protein OEO23_04750 [Gemmatimonadota bacterium]|nr:hypothetical protein [Gemmatimonadota bacterium]